jgi:hypothetical protein
MFAAGEKRAAPRNQCSKHTVETTPTSISTRLTI